MNYCAIIAEFNPLTNGHKHIINQAKEKTGLDIICLMSGNFVQRGEPAILDKYQRAISAIKNGASIILELPLIYALSSAEVFATGAIKILKEIPNISHLAFGIETDNTILLENLAKIKVEKNNQIKELIKKETKNGLNYNKAMIKALKQLSNQDENQINQIFNGSNNILALEYLTAIYREKANITPVYIKRTDSGYNSNKTTKIKINNNQTFFASASFIRILTNNNKFKKIKKLVPLETYNLLKNLNSKLLTNKDLMLETLIINAIRNYTPEELEKFYDYNQGLANLIYKTTQEETTLKNIIDKVSGKSIRPARVKKLLLYPLLNITKTNYESVNNQTLSINVLAVAENKKQYLSKLKNTSKTNLIVSVKDYNNCENKKSLELDQYSSNIYNLITFSQISKDKTIFI